jgi:hypothetical protein
MKILGLEGMTAEQVQRELDRGAKFVIFQYCVSIFVMTFKRPTDIYFVRAGEAALGPSLGYTLVSLVLGWWGFPWGPIYTIASIATNLGGGKDVTSEVLQVLAQTRVPTVARAAG